MLASQAGCADEHAADPHASSDATALATDAGQGGSARDAERAPHDGAATSTARDGGDHTDGSHAPIFDAAASSDTGVRGMRAADARPVDGNVPAPADAALADAQSADAQSATPACRDCVFTACDATTGAFRFRVFARSADAGHCYRLSFVYFRDPLPGLPYPEVTLSAGWAIEPAVVGEAGARCNEPTTRPYAARMSGKVEIEVNPPEEGLLFAKRVSGEIEIEFESDAGKHATRLRFDDLEIASDCSAL